MAIQHLTSDQVRRRCDPASFSFETTAELPYSDDIFGQPRAARAIDFGINMSARGYNLFVLGPQGTGRTTAIQRYLKKYTTDVSQPGDWVYVHNFADARRPLALKLRPGCGAKLRTAMDALIEQIQQKTPLAFETEEYDAARDAISLALQQAQVEQLEKAQARAAEAGFALVRTPSGLAVAPDPSAQTVQGTQVAPPLAPDQTEAQVRAQARSQPDVQARLNDELDDALRRVRAAEKQARAELEALDAQVAAAVVDPAVDEIVAGLGDWVAAQDRAAAESYVRDLREDLITQVERFKSNESNERKDQDDPIARHLFLNRYRVNVFVENCDGCGAPIVVEDYPTYYNLIGRLDRALTITNNPALAERAADHMALRPGALHRANGGFLILRARDVFTDDHAWPGLKRSLLQNAIKIEEPHAHTQLITAPYLEPQPIPLNSKVIFFGNSADYWAGSRDEDFRQLFKVRAEFSTTIDRTPENELCYALFLRNRSEEEGLTPFDRTGVAALVEYGSRYCEDQLKLTARFGEIADVAREAAFWAKKAGRPAVSAEDVRTAHNEWRGRVNRYEEESREHLIRGDYFVQTSGEAIGQVNGLSVFEMAEYEFARPSRITARSYVMRSGISDIDRGVNYTDQSHNKGIAIIDSYLSSVYSFDQPLSVSANITFEQSLSEHGGDSASCAMLIAMLSAVAQLPVPQSIAITGTLDQFGYVRPIGSANTKIEGFFDTVKARGLDGAHGVVIPAQNVHDLMLREDVVAAVREGKFHIVTVEHVDDLIEIVFDTPAGARDDKGKFPAGTLHAKVEAVLKEINEKLDGRRKDKDDEKDEKKPEPEKEPEPQPPKPPEPEPPVPGPPSPEPPPPEPPPLPEPLPPAPPPAPSEPAASTGPCTQTHPSAR
jgi:predicted ATP-dependent protease